jgi:hypothetical protein
VQGSPALGKYERGEGYVGFAQALILCGTTNCSMGCGGIDTWQPIPVETHTSRRVRAPTSTFP